MKMVLFRLPGLQVLHASLGLFDGGDKRIPFFQPYNGGHGPLPGPGRELVLKLRYGF